MRRILLIKTIKKNPSYKVAYNEKKFNTLRVMLNPACGLKADDRVYEVLREDGVIELIPEKLYQKMKAEYNIEEIKTEKK